MQYEARPSVPTTLAQITGVANVLANLPGCCISVSNVSAIIPQLALWSSLDWQSCDTLHRLLAGRGVATYRLKSWLCESVSRGRHSHN